MPVFQKQQRPTLKQLQDIANRKAIEFGHTLVWEKEGRFCRCGNPGCPHKGWVNECKGERDGAIFKNQCPAPASKLMN